MNGLDNTNGGPIARASVSINAPIAKVWDAFTNPEVIEQYMFGTKVISDWKEGSQITWKGEWQGRKYEERRDSQTGAGASDTIQPFQPSLRASRRARELPHRNH